MARHEDGETPPTSDDDVDGLTPDGTTSGESDAEHFSPEDEIREWVGKTESGSEIAAAGAEKAGWMGRVFGRNKQKPVDPPEPEEDFQHVAPVVSIEDAESRSSDGADEPDTPSLFAVPTDPEGPGSAIDITEPDFDADGEEVAAADAESDELDFGELADEIAVEEDGSSEASFAELWGASGAKPAADESSFEEFTSDDYLQASTREYAGLAEAVARAEEEGTQQIAVSAEIPGLESGLVGLEDVVSAEGGPETTDVIEPPSPSDLPMRVFTAFGLVILFAASLLSPYGIGALIFAVLGIAAGEMFAALIRTGYRPLSIFGFLGIAGALLGTWASGPVAVPIAMLVTAIAVFLFYATVPGRRSALENATLTLLVTAWIGGMGAFAFDLLQSSEYVWLVLGLVLTVAAMDIGQYFIGRRVGRRPLAPVVSPKKTVEGYAAGIIVAISIGAALAWAEPFELADGLLIGAVVAIVSPLGDLAVSVLKRALGIKDMGYILPGHGGVLDRIDAMIITIPALWIAYSWMGLLN